ncbi:hypothetical protein HanLR1_Chr07g0254241 [Helianthus annuus]|nr:hypothetical protein HanLR1_Chr07g0254241 [Helianthus annuus]
MVHVIVITAGAQARLGANKAPGPTNRLSAPRAFNNYGFGLCKVLNSRVLFQMQTYDYEKKIYNEHLESLQVMEKNYMTMASEVEKLRAELKKQAEIDRRTGTLLVILFLILLLLLLLLLCLLFFFLTLYSSSWTLCWLRWAQRQRSFWSLSCWTERL